MNLPPSNADDSITEQSVDWFMRLQEEDCTQVERDTFEEWLKSDPKHTAAFDKTRKIWDVSAQLAPTVTVPSAQHLQAQPKTYQQPPQPLAAAELPQRMANTQQRTRWSTLARVACVALFIFSSGGYMGWQLDSIPNSYHRYSAEQTVQHITLPDGSEVELNLNSQLSYANYRHHRSVSFGNGEAYFQVSHNKEQPFIIKAANGTITVTGTRFNVWTYQDNVVVAVTEGSVNVNSGVAEQTLTRGMQARYGAGGTQQELTISKTDTHQTLAWRQGQLILDNLTLAEALPQINRYLPAPLVLTSPAVAKLRIGGIYNTGDIQGMVKMLPKILPVNLKLQNDGSTQIMSRYMISSPQ
ncbi:MAG: FecR family protein [Pseudomonadales bacterium]|nr:FecR family protein [Pseudomonadales bacterium]